MVVRRETDPAHVSTISLAQQQQQQQRVCGLPPPSCSHLCWRISRISCSLSEWADWIDVFSRHDPFTQLGQTSTPRHPLCKFSHSTRANFASAAVVPFKRPWLSAHLKKTTSVSGSPTGPNLHYRHCCKWLQICSVCLPDKMWEELHRTSGRISAGSPSLLADEHVCQTRREPRLNCIKVYVGLQSVITCTPFECLTGNRLRTIRWTNSFIVHMKEEPQETWPSRVPHLTAQSDVVTI